MTSWPTCCNRPLSRSRADRGSAVVDFVLLAPLVLILVCTIVQAGIWVVVMAEAHRVADTAARPGAVATKPERVATTRARSASPQDSSVSVAREESDLVVRISVPMKVMLWRTTITGTATGRMGLEPR